MAKHREWLLFVDESGDFEDPYDPVSITGVLVAEADTPAFARLLRQGLERALPGVPYPLHATELNQTSFPLACWVRAPSDVERAALGRWAPELASLAGRVEAAASTDARLAKALHAVRSAPRLEQDLLHPVSNALKAHPELHGVVKALKERAEERVRGFLSELAMAYGAVGLTVVAAYGEPGVTTTRDRYLALLPVLFERLLAFFREQPGAHHKIWVRAASRGVLVAHLPRLELRAADVGTAVRIAESFPLHRPGDGGVDPFIRIVPHQPTRFDANVHPGLVLADFASNRLWGVLQHARSWQRVVERADQSLALPIERLAAALPAAGCLPGAASEGAPRAAIEAALAGAPPEAVVATPGWAVEQAQRWIRAVRSHAGRGA